MLAGGLPRPVLFSRYRTKGRISFGSFGKGKGLPHCNSEAPIILSPARLLVPAHRLYCGTSGLVFGRGHGGLFEEGSDRFFEVGVDGVGVGAVGLPDGMAVG